MTAPKPIGPKPRLEYHPPSSLIVDPRYQRSTDRRSGKKLIAEIVENFYWPFFGVLVATDNGDGTYCLIDGQHRAEAARQHPDVHSVPVMVIDEMTLAEQAQAFVAINKGRITLTSLQLHHAAVRAGDPQAVLLQSIATECGVTIAKNNRSVSQLAAGETVAIKQLSRILLTHGPDHLRLTLKTLMQAYGRTAGDLRGPVINAVSAVLLAAPERAALIAEKLTENDGESWVDIARAKARHDGLRSSAEALAEILTPRPDDEAAE